MSEIGVHEISQIASIVGAGYYNQIHKIDLQKKQENDQEGIAEELRNKSIHITPEVYDAQGKYVRN